MTTREKPLTRRQLTTRQQLEHARAQGQPSEQAGPGTPGPTPVPTPVPEQGQTELGTVLAFLERLEARVEGLEASGPSQFMPQLSDFDMPTSVANTYAPPSVKDLQATMIRSLNAAGQTVSRSIGPMENPAMLDKIPPKYHPLYRSGDLVRLNPGKALHGSDKLIGEMLDERGSNGKGEIVRIQGLTKSYQPKYSVYVQGLTTRNGDGYLESQLLPT